MSLPSRISAPGVGAWGGIAFLIAGLVGLPIATVLLYLFIPAWDVWSHLAQTVLGDYLLNTLGLIVGVASGVALIGVGTAWLVTMCEIPGRRWLEWLLLLPLSTPAYVVAYAYTGLFDIAGPVQTVLRSLTGWEVGDYWFPEIRSLGGAILVLTLVLYPYVYLLTRAAFIEQSVCVLEAGRVLGRRPARCFFEIALPLARPAIVGGVALALMESLSDFGTVQYFAVDNFTTGIYRTWLGLGEQAAAVQLAAILLLFVLLLLVLERRSRRGGVQHTSVRYRALPRFTLSKRAGWGAFAVCALVVFVGFLQPVGMLLSWAVQTAPQMVDGRFWSATWNSLGLAVGGALLAVGCALCLGYARRLAPSRSVFAASRIASLGYALPGLVVAVGILIPLGWLDQQLNAAWGTGLLLSGTVVALLFAYTVRFLAVAYNAVDASLAKVAPSMDMAARALGRSPRRMLIEIHTPLLRPTLLAAGLLVFVDVMKELPATLILRPFNFDTLALHIYALAADERLADCAPAAVLLVAVGILPVILLSRALAGARPGHTKEGPSL
ncbi:ABC transporter permease [Lacibacterium aquatile]|uniref:ABC transporter permease n=1 Tax=Lacibacterium aquatile TaxID=1168082 RepID=A0ABW5DRS1_9PROT